MNKVTQRTTEENRSSWFCVINNWKLKTVNCKFVLASRNRYKLVELRELFGIPADNLICAADFPGAPDPEENGATFVENALIKARALRDFTGLWAIADDSGLTVEALGGEPGVYSARYGGTHGDDTGNNRLLIKNLSAHPRPWRAAYECVIAIAAPDGREFTAAGSCTGEIIPEGRGTNGFGYDPFFIPDGFTRTFAELPPETKQTFSHRARAAAQIRATLQNIQ